MLLHVTASGVSFNVTVCYHFNCVKLPHHRSTAHSSGQYIVELQLLVCYHWHCSCHCVLSVWQLNIPRQRDSLDSVWWCHWCAIILSACYRWQRCSHCKWIIMQLTPISFKLYNFWMVMVDGAMVCPYTSDHGSPPSVLSFDPLSHVRLSAAVTANSDRCIIVT